jgi:hypothetical protein
VAGLSIVSRWGGRAAESLFAVLFPSDCRTCGTPLVAIFRLAVFGECLASMPSIAGCVCSVWGKRILSPYPVSGINGEPRCGLCCRILPHFAKGYSSSEAGLREFIHLLKYCGIEWAPIVLGACRQTSSTFLSRDAVRHCRKLVIDALRRAGA